jgi:thioredoxin reductase (NADPH)
LFDYDAIIVGGGPAGLTAGLELARAGHRALLLEKELFGGNLKNVDVLEDWPGSPAGIAGAQLANQLAEQAQANGLQLRNAAVTGVELFSSTRWVSCEDGQGFSAAVVIVATGSRFKELGVPGEAEFLGRGVIDCVPCDGGLFKDRAVAVSGSGDDALAGALYLARLASRVTVLAGDSAPCSASPTLMARALGHPRIEIRRGAKLEAILGADRVEAVTLRTETCASETLAVEGVVVRVGSTPNTEFLEGALDLDPDGRVVTGSSLDAAAPGVLAAGDARSGSTRSVAAAAEDGAAAARRASEQLARS